jgi:hypothetical protein
MKQMFEEIDAAIKGVTDLHECVSREAEVWERWEPRRKLMDFVQQHELNVQLQLNGIATPPECLDSSVQYPLLTPAGENWAHSEIRKVRDERIEFWMRIILPTISLIVSITALVFAVRR